MRVLLRYVNRREGGALEYRDADLVGEEITIGRSADQQLVLAGADVSFRHARIRQLRDGGCEIANVGTGDVKINDRAVASARIELGDEIRIGAHRAKRIASPPGFDLALEIELAERTDAEWSASVVHQGSRSRWGRRGWSWTLGTVFFGAGLVVPLLGVYIPRVQDVLRMSAVLPSDRWWDSGPLIDAHAAPPAGSSCAACHRVPFLRVRNAECGECHRDVTHHAAVDTSTGAALAAGRCASCHKEHRGAKGIVLRDAAFCVDCHGRLKSSLGDKTVFENVRDFATDHPEFRLTFLRPRQGQERVTWEHVRVAKEEPGAREQSNLKFNHKVHLDPKGVDTPTSKRRMTCADCHQPDESGVAMRPIGMKAHCSECHTLQFEDVSLPHGSVEQVLYVLRGYYQSPRRTSGLMNQEDVMVSRRREARRPGEPAQDSARETVNTLEENVQRAARDLFDRTLCIVCHEIIRQEPQQQPGWRVEPVRLNDVWMPLAHFSHKSHVQTDCVKCHGAETSEHSKDVLMPGIDECRKCHAGARGSVGQASTCVVCHWFHIPGKPTWIPNRERPVGGIHGES